jgi:hypothetical protein
MSNLKLLFNHDQLLQLTNGSGGPRIVLSLCGLPSLPPDTLKSETYICAEVANDNDVPNPQFRPVVACPDPPGWGVGEDMRIITHEQLLQAARFSMPVAQLHQELAKNLHIPGGIRQVSVEFDARVAGANPTRKFFVSFIIRDAAGAVVPGVPVLEASAI